MSDDQISQKLDKYKAETKAETEKFMKDVESIITNKHIDNTFATMINRRVKRERESSAINSTFIDNIKKIKLSKVSERKKQKQVFAAATSFQNHAKTLYKMAANEKEDITKILIETYGTQFDPDDVLIYADYKKKCQ
ncbi:MAG: hypothetical protein SGI96_13365 [Bacteroidota bacterium]|nr:hypothetical protein [Bacteroidota bacterium]